MLLLKKHMVELVRAGKKRQTIRFWRRAMVSAGRPAFCPGLGRVFITRVEVLEKLADLTEADAIADGFASRRELLAELRRIYGRGVPAGKRCYRVVFEWPAAAAEAAAANPGRANRRRAKSPPPPAVADRMQRVRRLKRYVLQCDPHGRLRNEVKVNCGAGRGGAGGAGAGDRAR